MEENVALEPSKQKQFVKSLKGIKKLIKKNKEKEVSGIIVSEVPKDEKLKKKVRKNRGLVYLSHIPHGFYENEMTQYFKQFGVVTNARVIRSKRTGNSKGFAFVEFRDTDVAQIVAETMNNYLMGKRLIKAVYIPPEKQRRNALRKKWNSVNNPRSAMRLKNKKAYNENKDEAGELKKARKMLSTVAKTKKKLTELGIDYDFTPVDIPEALVQSLNVKKEEKESVVVKEESKSKKNKKAKAQKDIPIPEVKAKKEQLKKDGPAAAKKAKIVEKDVKIAVKDSKKVKKEDVKEIVINKKEQKQKNLKLKEACVKPAENYIKIQQESDDESDSDFEFDSDEYDKMLEQDEDDSDVASGDDKESDGDEESDSDEEADGDEETDDAENDESDDEEESVIDIPPPKKGKAKPLPKVAVVTQPKKKTQKQPLPKVVVAPQPKKHLTKAPKPVQQKLPDPVKRKGPERAGSAATKKPKFEKQSTQKTVKKQFKKKK